MNHQIDPKELEAKIASLALELDPTEEPDLDELDRTIPKVIDEDDEVDKIDRDLLAIKIEEDDDIGDLIEDTNDDE